MPKSKGPALPEDLRRAVAYFWRHRETLRSQYPGHFVAILDDDVKASSEDYGLLAKAMAKKFPGRHAYLAFADALTVDEMRQRFPIAAFSEGDRSRWEAKAASEVFGR